MRIGLVAATVGCAVASLCTMPGGSSAAEVVRFASASVQLSEFQQKRAQARGEVPQPLKGDEIQATVLKPPGNDPFPVVLYLHDCGGLAPEARSAGFDPEQSATSTREGFWTKRLLSWGYAVVLVDGYTPRGMSDTCADPKRGTARVPDAYGALGYVAKQPWADPQRIGLLGFQTGDHWRVPVAGDVAAYVIGPERFKAAVAFVYSQTCGIKSPMEAPSLVINGASGPDRAETCPRQTAQLTEGGALAEERVAPELFKNFEPNSPMPDKVSFSDWIRSEPQQAEKAAQQVQEFFAQHLKRKPS